jgi:hypothetical protein
MHLHPNKPAFDLKMARLPATKDLHPQLASARQQLRRALGQQGGGSNGGSFCLDSRIADAAAIKM